MIDAAITLPAAIRIVVHDLTLRLNNRVIFDNLRFPLDSGQCAAVLGTSGVGKTCLLKIIIALMRPDARTVSCSDALPLAGRIAYMGQNDLLYPWMTVRKKMTRGARLLAGQTVLLITHDPQEACRLAHRLWVLAWQPLAAEPPRALDDPLVQLNQGALIRRLHWSST